MSYFDSLLQDKQELTKKVKSLNLQLSQDAAYRKKQAEKERRRKQFAINKNLGRENISQNLNISDSLDVHEEPIETTPFHDPIQSNDTQDGFDSFREEFIQELCEILKTPPNRRRYSKKFKELAFCLYHLCPQAYRFLRCIITLPSDTIIYKDFQEQVRDMKNQLIDTRIPSIIQNYRITNNISEEEIIPVVVGIDACAFDRLTDDNHK